MAHNKTVDMKDYYNEFHGHLIEHVETVFSSLGERPKIWLAGDSSLDNKYWISFQHLLPAIRGYENILDPPLQVPDVCYHLNDSCIKSNGPAAEYACINTAVEATMLRQRLGRGQDSMLAKDIFLRDHISAQDILVVSVGGNDVALNPKIRTAWNMFKLVYFNSMETLQDHPEKAWGLNYFAYLFGDLLLQYIKKLIAKTRPRLIVVCMIYFPDEMDNDYTWASKALGFLKYNSEPELLQAAIRAIYHRAVTKLAIEGVPLVGHALFEQMDGKNPEDYVARVEPSATGGAKIAAGIMHTIESNLTC